jgi:hypothetical protein
LFRAGVGSTENETIECGLSFFEKKEYKKRQINALAMDSVPHFNSLVMNFMKNSSHMKLKRFQRDRDLILSNYKHLKATKKNKRMFKKSIAKFERDIVEPR